MLRAQTLKIIEDFYKYFNASEFDKLYTLISNDVEHEMNNEGIASGKNSFIQFMTTSTKHYKERVDNLVIMVSEDGRHAAAKFITRGKYFQMDDSKIPAKGQHYELAVINYFKVKNGLIIKASC